MSELELFSEISLDYSIINIDENSDDLTINKKYLNFKDSLSNIFGDKNTNVDNESEIDYNQYYYLKKRVNPNIKDNLINSIENYDDTKGKSNESQKIHSVISDSKCNNNINNLFKNLSEKDLEHNNNNNKINEETFLGKKKKIFRVEYSNIFNIFSFCERNNNIQKLINDALNDKNSKIKKNGREKRRNKTKFIVNRKQNFDNIRKKIKARFLKALKNALNAKLKSAGSKYFFTFLPQIFIINLSKKLNKSILDLTLNELFSKNFFNKKIEKKADLKKYNHNLFVLKYLENNKDICEKSKFNIIKDMKFSQIFNEYLISKEFEIEISTLIQQKENEKYIKNYIIKARNFLNFFSQ